MADTDWNAFPDSSPLPTDILLVQRGAGGINLPVSSFLHYDSTIAAMRIAAAVAWEQGKVMELQAQRPAGNDDEVA